jgi:DNA-binding MarR family transcriptional regulator
MRSIDAVAHALHDGLIALARRCPLRDPLATSCDELGLRPAQLHALLWVGHDGPLTMGALARRVAVTEKTATGIVDRLERDGLLERARDGADRRVIHVRLTARGGAASRRIEKVVHGSLVRVLTALDAVDRKALLRILDALVESVGDERKGTPRCCLGAEGDRLPVREGSRRSRPHTPAHNSSGGHDA